PVYNGGCDILDGSAQLARLERTRADNAGRRNIGGGGLRGASTDRYTRYDPCCSPGWFGGAGIGDDSGSRCFGAGNMAQSRASNRGGRVVAAAVGDRFLEQCAIPAVC